MRISSIKSSLALLVIVSALMVTLLASGTDSSADPKPVVIGYVGGFRGLIDVSKIDAKKLSIINYAFVDVQGNRAFLTNEATDSTNFRNLNELKKINPALRIVISIGGWSWSENFSDAVLKDTSRLAFAKSAADIVAKYNLDGVDIDWEYPGIPGEDGNVYRPEDKENFALMFRDCRKYLDSLKKITNKQYLLTTAVGGFPQFVDNANMKKSAAYLDYVNLMSYDYHPKDIISHHTNLYPSSDFEKENSADKAVKTFMKAGVPAHKLVVGMAFYGRSWFLDSSTAPVLKRKALKQVRGGGYSFLKDSVAGKNGFTEHWDDKASAPYLYNDSTRQFITYDNERSVKEKCSYVKKNKLGGVMFWEYNSDPKLYLLTTAHENLDHQ